MTQKNSQGALTREQQVRLESLTLAHSAAKPVPEVLGRAREYERYLLDGEVVQKEQPPEKASGDGDNSDDGDLFA